eukprot:TRINITY_DN77426_c0_g1_i1.p1 TRINITY_DN77426_c0_g1~~TRINITY_DN77426_c0_g1_i1.p1  ORF type:complete len:452 (+),score=56.59 TRINITY_DN77426_c0_g1_i1:74-1357(+)
MHASPGCKAPSPSGQLQEDGWQKVMVEDFQNVERRFWLVEPPAVRVDARTHPAALLLSFHGQFGDAEAYAKQHNFAEFVPSGERMIFAYPQGMDDGSQGSGWNVGVGGDVSTCLESGVDYACYASCSQLNQCGRCNWSTCYDDRRFVHTILTTLANTFCVDLHRVYLQGESNGAMFTHYLLAEMPGTFAAAVAVYGNPLLGYAAGAGSQILQDIHLARQTSFLQLHGRQDTLIPASGGVSSQGWIYEPLDKVQGIWAGIHNCSGETSHWENPWIGGTSSMSCVEYPNCNPGTHVARCLYDGRHGDWPDDSRGEQLTVWFVLQFQRSSTGLWRFSRSFQRNDELPTSNRAAVIVLAVPFFVAAMLAAAAFGAGASSAAMVIHRRITRRRQWRVLEFSSPAARPVGTAGGEEPTFGIETEASPRVAEPS